MFGMRRREFITLLGGAVAAWPLAAWPQQLGRMRCIGVALAVLRLITSSYFTGVCTGRSLGFSPLRIRAKTMHLNGGTRMLPKSVVFCLIWLLSSQGMAEGFDSDFYHARYKLTDPYAKAVDNHGDGFEDLYGVRNFREVLKGVLFRGGANNAYNDHGRRNTKHPLPKNGLDNLCEEGFKTVVYLYPTNYDKAPRDLRCRSIRGSNHMDYPQIRISKARVLLETIFAAIKDSEMGPVYMHCWNGWHASGYISALSLRQFCGVSGSDAVEYWIRNTDNNDGPEYNDHKRTIAAFVPYTDLMIDTTTQRKICPQL